MDKVSADVHTDDIVQVKVPLPFSLKWVNAYLIRGRDGYTIVDPGLRTEEAERMWAETLAGKSIGFGDITRIVLTHHHPDHYGLAGWFRERSGADVYMSGAGQRQAALLWGEGQPLATELLRLFAQHGMNEELLAEMRAHLESFLPCVEPAPVMREIVAGEPFRLGDRMYETVETGGHAAGHISFYDRERRIMLCGDHVLPHISPNVGYLPGIDENPLATFLHDLERIGRYEVIAAFPGHRDPFARFAERTRELIRHHGERLAFMRDKLAEPTTAYRLCLDVFSEKLSTHQLRFALAETLAHLLYLRNAGAITEQERDGILYYRKA